MFNNNFITLNLGECDFSGWVRIKGSPEPKHSCEANTWETNKVNKEDEASADVLLERKGGYFLSLASKPLREAKGRYLAKVKIQFCPFCGTKLD